MKKLENQMKAKEYAKKQREIITQKKDTKTRGQLNPDLRDTNENSSPNIAKQSLNHHDIIIESQIVNIEAPMKLLPKNTILEQQKQEVIQELSEENAS